MGFSPLSSALVALLLTGVVVAAPVDQTVRDVDVCTSPRTRRAWHTLSSREKKTYIDAELCLMSKPATLDIRGSKTKFDELQAAHVLKMEIAHFVGQFLPFHRLFLWAHEQALQNECGYTGAQPYWEEELDAGAFSKSILLDPVLGFGGDGTGSTGCIEDGPFANYTNPIGPGYEINSHCINRHVNEVRSQSALPSVVEGCMNMTTFLTFWPCIEEGGPHGAGHGGIGGQMSNPISSPGDPLFYLHHAWLDRLWTKWQWRSPGVRLKEIGGINKTNVTAKVPPPGVTPLNLTRPVDVPIPWSWAIPEMW